MTADEIRADMASRKKHMAALAEKQAERATELAELLCPFKVGDRLVSDGDDRVEYLFAEIGLSGDSDWYAYLTLIFEDGTSDKRLFTSDYLMRHFKLAPEPTPDPAIEAVRNVVMSKWGGDAGSRTNVMDIIAALDAARAERRERAQERRVKAVRDKIYFVMGQDPGSATAADILAAADAAGGGR